MASLSPGCSCSWKAFGVQRAAVFGVWKGLVRAVAETREQLDAEEKRVWSQRSGHAKTATAVGKQVLLRLIAEILESI